MDKNEEDGNGPNGQKQNESKSVQGGWNWDDDELTQCLSRPLGGVIPFVMVCIQSGHIFYTVTVALLQTVSRTAYEGGVSKILACYTIYRACTTQHFKLSVELADICLLHQALSLS
jgi:hypothetical protein